MRLMVLALVTWVGLLSCFPMATATAGDISSDPVDPSNAAELIRERNAQRDSLFGVSPLQSLHDAMDKTRDKIYEATHLKLGLRINHLFQGLSEALPDNDKSGTATDMDIVGTWELTKPGEAEPGKPLFQNPGPVGLRNHGTPKPRVRQPGQPDWHRQHLFGVYTCLYFEKFLLGTGQ